MRFGVQYAENRLAVEWVPAEGESARLLAVNFTEAWLDQCQRAADIVALVARQLERRSDGVAVVGKDRKGLNEAAQLVLDRHRAKGSIARGDDMNKVRPSVLLHVKALMECNFDAHLLKPGDAGYVYDKRIDFEDAVSESSWD